MGTYQPDLLDIPNQRRNKLYVWLLSLAALLLIIGPPLGLIPYIVYGVGGPYYHLDSDSDCAIISSSSTFLSTFFNIDILLGNMSFGMAKFVDVAFDVVIGVEYGGGTVVNRRRNRVFIIYAINSIQ